RAAALLMTMAMVLAMALPTQAATTLATGTGDVVTTSETVTISDIPTEAKSLGFDTYQVLYATYTSGTNELEYHLTDWALAALVTSGKYTSEDLAIEAIVALGSSMTGNDTTEQNDIVNALAAYVAANSVEKYTAKSWSYSTNAATADLPVGSYLVIPHAENMAFLNMLVSVSATRGTNNEWNVAASGAVLKGNKVGVTKVVEEKDAGETADGSTDVQIGGTVSYTVTADVPCFASNATGITFKIEDVPENVKIDTDTLKVYGVNGTTNTKLAETTNYTMSYDSGTLTIDFSDQYLTTFWDSVGKTYPYTSVKITYDAELLSSAVVNDENTNTVTLTYKDANHTVNTANDTSDVYTYKAVLTKKDASVSSKTLADAIFKVTDQYDKEISFVASGSTYRVADSDDTDTVTKLTTGSDGTLTIIGLDSSKTYTVEEITAPTGYSVNSNVIEFTITASSSLDGTISGYTSTEYTNSKKETEATSKTWSISSSSDATQLELSLTDTELSTLPATGSVGIIVFTIAGVAIMILALVLINSGKSKAKKA
ncbi:MAG: isopeptide-forming domain-containing fimbrial protein, partial [Lachnospiraceae bacterium]|nr:isopeptide-forming domain-containing fimbrial protein [Lachnospiraceae bacterium]